MCYDGWNVATAEMNKTTPQNSQQKLHGQKSWNRRQLSGVDREEVDKRSVFGQPRHQLRATVVNFFYGPKQTFSRGSNQIGPPQIL